MARRKKKRGPRQATYSREVEAALIKVWEVFDYPCGQRLVPALRQETERLRKAKELVCPEIPGLFTSRSIGTTADC